MAQFQQQALTAAGTHRLCQKRAIDDMMVMFRMDRKNYLAARDKKKTHFE
jgi:hypothetical protein